MLNGAKTAARQTSTFVRAPLSAARLSGPRQYPPPARLVHPPSPACLQRSYDGASASLAPRSRVFRSQARQRAPARASMLVWALFRLSSALQRIRADPRLFVRPAPNDTAASVVPPSTIPTRPSHLLHPLPAPRTTLRYSATRHSTPLASNDGSRHLRSIRSLPGPRMAPFRLPPPCIPFAQLRNH